ncbi:Protein disulfide-isomerase [Astathelohania contejeani]|uniref:Protein disulfide-isomerase n=1 Tax=Astathelohania contejeani TaxID=164912 RepID=A0ABQ7HXY4_9MICR|nr:Protein disulfide-isomerase [Thelohania contejeani]
MSKLLSIILNFILANSLFEKNIIVYTNHPEKYKEMINDMNISAIFRKSEEDNTKIENNGREIVIKKKNNFSKIVTLLNKYPPPTGEMQGLRRSTVILFVSDDLLSEIEEDEIPKEINFFISSDTYLAKKYEIPFPGIYGYNAEYRVTYKYPISGDIRSIVNTIASPILDEIKESNVSYYQNSTLPVLYIFFKDYNHAKKEFLQPAIDFRYKVKLALVRFDPERNALASFGISEKTDLPCIVNITMRKKFKEINLTREKLSRFLSGYIDKTIEPYYASGPIPTDNDKRGAKIIVRNTYKKMVEENNKDALLVFHSPHCMWCIKLKPVIEELGQLANGKVLVGLIDMSVNDMPEWDIRAYPTIYLVQARSKKKIAYDRRDRSLKELIEFIKERGEDKVDLSKDLKKETL